MTSMGSNADLQPHEKAAVDTYFDGDQDFYQVFRSASVEQFAIDLKIGDDACAAGDATTLRRTAHSLKSVLLTLGYAEHSACAKGVELAAQQAPWAQAVAGWGDLRQRIVTSFKLA
jgi:HPt (histidine-containing phosphotransfer) domain-containing protein